MGTNKLMNSFGILEVVQPRCLPHYEKSKPANENESMYSLFWKDNGAAAL